MPSHACRLTRVYSSGYSSQSVRLRPFFSFSSPNFNLSIMFRTFATNLKLSLYVCVSVSHSLSTRSSVIEKIKRRQKKRETSEEIDSGELGLTNQRRAFNEFNFLSTFFFSFQGFLLFSLSFIYEFLSIR